MVKLVKHILKTHRQVGWGNEPFLFHLSSLSESNNNNNNSNTNTQKISRVAEVIINL
jgi:hypothetical protein